MFDNPLVVLGLMTLATARLTRLVTFDELFRPFREWVGDKTGNGLLGYLVNCPWCMSIWLGFGVAGTSWAFSSGEWIWWIWTALSMSYITGLLAEKVE